MKQFQIYFESKSTHKITRKSDTLLKLPNLRLEYSRGSFCYSGAKLYNELSHVIRRLDILQFKAHIMFVLVFRFKSLVFKT